MLSTNDIEGTGFRGQDIAQCFSAHIQTPDDQGPHTVGITHSKKLRGRANHKTKGTLAALEGNTEGGMPVVALVDGLGNGVGNPFGIGGGGKVVLLVGEFLPQAGGVDEVTVMGNRDRAQATFDNYRLSIDRAA